jgi:hypothetical protein
MKQFGQSSQSPGWPVLNHPGSSLYRGALFGVADSSDLAKPPRNVPQANREVFDVGHRRGEILGLAKMATALQSIGRLGELYIGATKAGARIGEIYSHDPRTTTTEVSEPAERFAKGHGLWGSLVVLKSLVNRHKDLVSAVRVDLVSDPEISGWFTLCFCVRTSAGLPEVLEFDDRLRDLMIESIPAKDQIYFAIGFQFEKLPNANGC